MRGIHRWLRLRSVERDVDEELSFHRQERVRELEARGLSAGEARAEAARLFGDERMYREQLVVLDGAVASRRQWRTRAESARDAVRHAARSVLRSPGLSGGVVLAFALGIGANATMFATVERLLLRPPAHIERPQEVRRLLVERQSGWAGDGRITGSSVAWPDYRDLTAATSFVEVAAYALADRVEGSGAAAEPVRSLNTGASWWRVLGVRPALGRFYTDVDDAVDAAPTVVISHGYWQRKYGGAPDVLGRTLSFADGDYTIIGVTPRGFTGVDLRPVDVFVPFQVAFGRSAGSDPRDNRNWYFARMIARLAPGVTAAAAEAEATALHRAGREATPRYDREARIIAAPLLAARGPNAPAEATVARWLLGVAAVVLLIACLNVANLLLARMIRQARETAVRLALGISRRRLVGQILLEGLMLGLAGGVAALAVATWGGTFVQRMLLPDVEWGGGATRATLLLVGLLALLAGLGSAVVPAVQATARGVTAGLRGSSGGVSRSTARLRSMMTALQAGLSVILLIGAGLFVRSLDRVKSGDLGLDPWDVVLVTPQFESGGDAAAGPSPLYEAGLERIRQTPGVAAAAAAVGVPFYSVYAYDLHVPGRDSIPGSPGGGPYAVFAGSDYFRTLRIELLRGRVFDERDTRTSPRVIALSESFARVLWPDESALGRCIHVYGAAEPCAEVVGVVEDAHRDGIVEKAAYQYYVPLQQHRDGVPEGLLIRVSGDAPRVLEEVRSIAHAVDPRIRYLSATALDDLLAPELRKWRLGATLFTLFGILALVVAATGLYSVLAFDVAQRVREIGLRVALGATRGAIVRMVVARAVRVTLLGSAAGAAAAFLLAPRLNGLLYETGPRDPLTFGVVIASLVIVSLLAAGPPARKAARLEPNVALRTE